MLSSEVQIWSEGHCLPARPPQGRVSVTATLVFAQLSPRPGTWL